MSWGVRFVTPGRVRKWTSPTPSVMHWYDRLMLSCALLRLSSVAVVEGRVLEAGGVWAQAVATQLLLILLLNFWRSNEVLTKDILSQGAHTVEIMNLGVDMLPCRVISIRFSAFLIASVALAWSATPLKVQFSV